MNEVQGVMVPQLTDRFVERESVIVNEVVPDFRPPHGKSNKQLSINEMSVKISKLLGRLENGV